MNNTNEYIVIQYDVYSHILILAKDILYENKLLNNAFNKKKNCFSYLVYIERDELDKVLMVNLDETDDKAKVFHIAKAVYVTLLRFIKSEGRANKSYDDQKVKIIAFNHFNKQLGNNADILNFIAERRIANLLDPTLKVINWRIESVEPLIEPLIPT